METGLTCVCFGKFHAAVAISQLNSVLGFTGQGQCPERPSPENRSKGTINNTGRNNGSARSTSPYVIDLFLIFSKRPDVVGGFCEGWQMRKAHPFLNRTFLTAIKFRRRHGTRMQKWTRANLRPIEYNTLFGSSGSHYLNEY